MFWDWMEWGREGYGWGKGLEAPEYSDLVIKQGSINQQATFRLWMVIFTRVIPLCTNTKNVANIVLFYINKCIIARGYQ